MILVVLWALGLMAGTTFGGVIHALLVIAHRCDPDPGYSRPGGECDPSMQYHPKLCIVKKESQS